MAGLVVLFAFAAFYPPAPLSPRIIAWREQGTFFKSSNHNIFYIDVTGSGKQGTVICLHGFPTFSWDWSKVLPGLKEQFSRVILLDFLGFGLSDKPVSHKYSIFEQADIVTLLANRLKLTSVHLLSHDYGDTVALELLARFNDQVGWSLENSRTATPALKLQSLTMLNGGIFTETNRPRLIQKLLLLPLVGPLMGRLTFFGLFKMGFGEVFGQSKPSDEEFHDFYTALCHKSGHLVSASLLQYIPERHDNKMRWEGALRDTLVPVAMIYGPGDPVNPPEFAQLFLKIVPQHMLVILDDGIGHYPQWEDVDSTLYHIQKFMTKVSDLQT